MIWIKNQPGIFIVENSFSFIKTNSIMLGFVS